MTEENNHAAIDQDNNTAHEEQKQPAGEWKARCGRYWNAFKKGTNRFVRKRPEWLFTMLFFIIIVIIYVWQVKANDHLTDIEYVKHDIEKSEPLKQIAAINNLVQNEEFDIDRNFLTKSIRVKPHLAYEAIPNQKSYFETNSRYGFMEGDSNLYLLENKWQKLKIPIKNVYNIISDAELLFFCDSSRLAYWSGTGLSPTINTFNSTAMVSLMQYSGQAYFFANMFGVPDGDSLRILSTYPTEYGSPFNDSISTIPLPPDIMDFKIADGNLIFHTYHKNRHSLYTINTYPKDTIKFIPDAELNKAVAGDDKFSWFVSNGHCIILNTTKSLVTVFDMRNNRPATVLKINKNEFFTDIPEMLSKDTNIFWLTGHTLAGYGVARIKLGEKNDSLRILNIPKSNTEEGVYSTVNLNQKGLYIINVVWTYGHKPSSFQILNYSNAGKKLDSVKIDDLIDQSILEDMSVFEVHFPKYSANFEFTVTSNNGIGACYQVTPSGDKANPDINPVQDADNEDLSSIAWPSKQFFKIESIPDYFFGVILIIGVIIFYFFGLFYVMDFKNRDQPYEAKQLPVLDELPTLREKLDYTKNTMGSLKLRSEIMLWLGIVIGVAGMFAFVLSLKTFFSDSASLQFNAEFTVRMLRTFAIFSFMEVFSFYFLKQYRIIFNEYKRFYSLYLRLMNYYQFIESMKMHPDDATNNISYKSMRDAMLADCINMHDDSNLEKVKEFEKSSASELAKVFADKMPMR